MIEFAKKSGNEAKAADAAIGYPRDDVDRVVLARCTA
jgi:hypothetical protein